MRQVDWLRLAFSAHSAWLENQTTAFEETPVQLVPDQDAGSCVLQTYEIQF